MTAFAKLELAWRQRAEKGLIAGREAEVQRCGSVIQRSKKWGLATSSPTSAATPARRSVIFRLRSDAFCE